MIVQDHATTLWTLTEFGSGEHQNRVSSLPPRACIVGRSSDVDFTIADASVSKQHAQLEVVHGKLIVRDLNSRNGTFVNCCLIQEAVLKEGDLLQFANSVYRVECKHAEEAMQTQEAGILPWAQTLLLFDKLITERAVQPHYQPILQMNDRLTIGYEVLARSKLEGLRQPAAMFQAADRLNQNATLSELMRDEGLCVARKANVGNAQIFLNTHPCEVVTERLINSLHDLRGKYPDANIMIEIHEGAVVDTQSVKQFRELLNDLHMGLSYDDFGAGQGRLVELGEVPPDVLKFDMGMIRDIDKAPATKQEMLSTLVRLSNDLGCQTLAEGVETEAEHRVCVEMGFTMGQGYLYGRPAPLVNE